MQNVSEATIRRALDEMSSEGKIERTRGCAILQAEKSTSFEHAYNEKAKLMIDERRQSESLHFYLVVDHSKFGKVAMTRVCPLRDVDEVIVDDGLTLDMQNAFIKANIPFQLVPIIEG